MNDIRLLYIDLFCGAGGTSTGVEKANYKGRKCAKVIACVNHDANAIASHAANHPEAQHYTEDMRTLDLRPLAEHTAEMRRMYPMAKVVLWASLECTNFSRAKGGLPRDANSRTLAEHLFRYIEVLIPDFIQIENVEEFMSWGDLDENGKPISRDKGRLYTHWVENVKAYGYKFDHRILNAADYGAYTSRKRFFGIFAKPYLPIVWPKPTHSKTGAGDLFGSLEKWKPVKEVLDFADEGESIFNRKKPLSPKTLERIYAGLIKFVAGDKDAFLVKYNSMNQGGKYQAPGIDQPCPVVSTQNRLGIAQVSFLSKQYGGRPSSKNSSIEAPAGTITCIDHHAFISAYYGNGNNHSVNMPSPTITTKDRFSVVKPEFIANNYSGGGQLSSLDNPCPAVMTNPKQNVIACKWYLMNPQFSNAGGSVEKPCFTLIAKMDKKPPYLIATECGQLAIEIYETDSGPMRKIKEFMALYGIVDIKNANVKNYRVKANNGVPGKLHHYRDADRPKEVYRQCGRSEYSPCSLRSLGRRNNNRITKSSLSNDNTGTKHAPRLDAKPKDRPRGRDGRSLPFPYG